MAVGYNKGMRFILHCDLNNFYASVECHENPSLKGNPVVVCGRVEDRHGIVLAKNGIAKAAGVKTGDVLWEAKQKCPGIIAVEARHNLYLKYSRLVRKIYLDFTDRIEPFGIDEAWLDITGSVHNFSEAAAMADAIRERVKSEVGLTISVGVSFCKVFAKLGSDMKKPDATTTITDANFKQLVWPLPVSDLLYVGRATTQKFADMTIKTIGDLATFDPAIIHQKLGKVGDMLVSYARGEECEDVHLYDQHDEIKSVGNSMTYFKDLSDPEDIKALFLILSESVVARMKKYGFKKARNLSITVTDNNLSRTAKMMKMSPPTDLASEIAAYAFGLFEKEVGYRAKVRALGVTISDFCDAEQMGLFDQPTTREKQANLQAAVENIRSRFGRNSVQRAIVLKDERMKDIDIVNDHIINPSIKEDPQTYTQKIYHLD